MVKHSAVNREIVGSSPTVPANLPSGVIIEGAATLEVVANDEVCVR